MASKIIPPQQTLKGHATEVSQATVGAIPFVGGAISGVLNAVFPSELERRRAVWEVAVSEALNKLDIHKLAEDDEFLSILIIATEAARRTHKSEQISRLQSAIRNHTKIENFDIKVKFLQWIDEFTEYEFHMFSLIRKHPQLSKREIDGLAFGDLTVAGNAGMRNLVLSKIHSQNKLIRIQVIGEDTFYEFSKIGEQFVDYCGL